MGVRGAARAAARVTARATALGVVLAVAACGSTTVHLSKTEVPPTPAQRARPAPVNVCKLLTARQVSHVVGVPLHVVGAELLDPAIATYQCEWGRTFGVPLVSVTLATAAVPQSVFTQAYGDARSASSTKLSHFAPTALAAYARRTPNTARVAVHLRASILTVTSQRVPSKPPLARIAYRLARRGLRRIPPDPRLYVPPLQAPCTRLAPGLMTAVMGTTPRRISSFRAGNGSLLCTWSGEPGVVRIALHRDPADVASVRRDLDRNGASPVDLHVKGWTGWSRDDTAGDVLAFGPGPRLVEIAVVPAAGWSTASIPTSPAQLRLARAAVRALGRP